MIFARALVMLSILLLAACASTTRQVGQAVVDAQGTDFASLDRAAYVQLALTLAGPLDLSYTAESAARSGPLRIEALDKGLIVLWRDAAVDGGGEVLTLITTTATGVPVASVPLALGKGCRFADISWKAAAIDGRPQLDVTIDGGAPGSVSALHWAVTSDGPALLRCRASDGSLANARLAQDHPDLVTQAGNIAAKNRIERLAATVWLASPERAAERGKPGVRSHLQSLAVGTDLWLTQAAAELLTLPTE